MRNPKTSATKTLPHEMEAEKRGVSSLHVALSYQARRELLEQVVPVYQAASLVKKHLILSEFVKITGYARKSALRLLNHPPEGPHAIRRPRLPLYGPEVQQALFLAWSATAHSCAQRLVPYLPDLLADLERFGHVQLSEEQKRQLLAMSVTTAERFLRTQRKPAPRGLSTTKAGALLKGQIPIRTFAQWDDAQPGFFEADLVAHCGGHLEGDYLYTLTLTDVATGWTECLPLLNRSPETVLAALRHARALVPFPMRGLDTDNGKEFLNAALLAYCEQEQITFTRGRPMQKNDQCYVEQKNGAVVRPFVGHDRLRGEWAYQQLGEVYRALRLSVNCFQPSMKHLSSSLEGEKVRRVYDQAKTPLQRLLLSGVLPPARAQELREAAQTLDPLRLVRQIDELQRALWRCREQITPASVVRFSLDGCVALAPTCVFLATDDPTGQDQETTDSLDALLQPRSPRDPFADEWPFIVAFVTAHPQCRGRELFQELERRHPGRYTPSHLNTLAIGLRQIRAHQLNMRGECWPTEVIQAVVPDTSSSEKQEALGNPVFDGSSTVSDQAGKAYAEEAVPVSSEIDQERLSSRQPAPWVLRRSAGPRDPHEALCQASASPSSAEEKPACERDMVAPLSVAQAGQWFLEDQQTKGHSPHTIEWHQFTLKQFQQYLTRRHLSLLNDVTETEVRRWLAFLRAEPSATGSVRSVKTILAAARSLHAFCAWAVRQGYLLCTPFVRGMVPWMHGRPRQWEQLYVVEPAMFEQVLHACRSVGLRRRDADQALARNRALLRVLWDTGMLVSEVCALQMGDVDARFQMVHIQGPGARERHLPLGGDARRALRTYLRQYRGHLGPQDEHDPVFLSTRGQPLTPNGMTSLFQRLNERAGLGDKSVSPSQLRDTFAIRFLQQSGNLRALQERLGLEDAVSVICYDQFCQHASALPPPVRP